MKSSLWYFLMALYTGEFSEDIIYIYIVVCNNPQRKTRIQEHKKKGRLHWLHVISTCLTSKTPLQKPSWHNWNIQIWGNYPPSKVPTNQWDMQLISTSNIDIFPFQKARNCHTNLTRMQRLGLPRIPARHQALCAGRRHALKRPWRLCSALWVCARFAGIQDLCWLDDFFGCWKEKSAIFYVFFQGGWVWDTRKGWFVWCFRNPAQRLGIWFMMHINWLAFEPSIACL